MRNEQYRVAEQKHYAKLRAQGYVKVTDKDGKTTLVKIK